MSKERIRKGAVPVQKNLEEAKEMLHNIWYQSELGLKTPQERRAAVEELYTMLPEEVAAAFEELTDVVVDGRKITLSQSVAHEATREAREELERRRRITAGPSALSRSAGERRHIRRIKANQRRGTKPRDIH